jgi:hypothetical protein
VAVACKFDLKIVGRLGPDQGYEKSLRILNRVVEWGENKTRHKADQRYADIIMKDVGVKGNSKSVVTPVVKGENDKGDVPHRRKYIQRNRAPRYSGDSRLR